MSRPQAPQFDAFDQAFLSDGDDRRYGYQGLLRQHHAGDLIVPSGHIVACDPGFADSETTQPFAPTLLPGRYPVLMGIIPGADGDQRVAYALLRAQAHRPVRWTPAVRAGATHQDGAGYGYTVESGLGCFMDAQAARVLMQRLRTDPAYNVRIAQAVDKTFVDTWGAATLSLAPQTRANVIVFSSGAGEGIYATFVGYDADDHLSCFVTDFALL